MANRLPLVLVNGNEQQLPSTDTIQVAGLGIGTTPSFPLDLLQTGVVFSGNVFDLGRLIDTGVAGKGLHLGFDNTQQVGVIVGASASADSGMALWGFHGTAYASLCQWTFGNGQQFGLDNAQDIGATSTGRPKDIHAGGDLYLGGKIRSYNSDTPVGGGVPSLVAQVTRLSQSTGFSATTLYTPAASGTYTAELYLVTTTAGSAGTVTATVSWTDDAGTQSFTTPTVALATLKALQQIVLPIRSTATAIQYSATVTGATGSPRFALFVDLLRKS